MTEPIEEPTSKRLNATVFEWTIDNFMSQNAIKLTSDEFTIPGLPGIKWQLVCYPKDVNYNKEFASVYLNKCIDNIDCNVEVNKCHVGIVNSDGLIKYEKDSPSLMVTLEDDWENTLAWRCLVVSRNQLIDEDLLVDGALKLRVKINQANLICYLDDGINQNSISQQFDFDNLKHCDVRLKTDDNTFEAHKFILTQQSPYFDKMFNGEFKEQVDNEVDLTMFRSDVIEEVLRFIYTRQVLELDELSEQLLVAADYFQLHYLKSLCEDNMTFRISVENCFHFLIIAEQYNLAGLKKAAMRFIYKKRKRIDKSVFENFFKDNVALTVDLYRYDA